MYVCTKPENNKFWDKGFTLAEVLITIGVIGVVAALVIPNLVANYKKKETVLRVKAAYSIFSDVIKMAVEEYGPVSGWEIGDANTQLVAEKYFTPYLKGVTKASVNMVRKYPMITLSDYTYHGAASYHGGNNAYMLPNGMYFNLYMYGNNSLWIVVDINGMTAPPNILGKDGFVFDVNLKTSVVRPAGYNYTRKQLLTNEQSVFPHEKCLKDGALPYYRGAFCAAVIEKDGWTISKDYPW